MTSQQSQSQQQQRAVWLNALDDPVAGLRTFAGGIDTGTLDGGGDAQLAVADLGSKLKVYSGVSLASEHVLLEPPVACCVHYVDEAAPRLPAVAVAAATSVYLYRGASLKPFSRFALPPAPVHDRESEVWQTLQAETCDAAIAQTKLRDLRSRGLALTSRSLELAIAESGTASVVVARRLQELMPQAVRSCITCMTTVPQQRDDQHAASCIVLGTEAGQVLILTPGAMGVLQRIVALRAAPIQIVCSGVLDIDCRIAVACRNRCIYLLRPATTAEANAAATGTKGGSSRNAEGTTAAVLELESQVVSMAAVGKHLFVACMDCSVHAFSLRGSGRRLFSMYMPAVVLTLETLFHSLTGSKALLVSLANGEVRLYSAGGGTASSGSGGDSGARQQSQLLGTLQLPSPAVAMRFGQYGRERGVLVAACQNGSLAIRVLSRASSDLSALVGVSGPPPEQDVPLRVPKKTSLYVEQAQHERDNAPTIHRAFQRDLYRLRLTTARAYVRVMTEQQGPVSHYAGSTLRLSARVQGLGPMFRLRLLVENTGRRAISAVPIALTFNPASYRVARPHGVLPILVPGQPFHFDTKITCLSEGGATGEPVTVLVGTADSTLPVIMAVVQMPASSDLLFN